jgi:hypothetical protein
VVLRGHLELNVSGEKDNLEVCVIEGEKIK